MISQIQPMALTWEPDKQAQAALNLVSVAP